MFLSGKHLLWAILTWALIVCVNGQIRPALNARIVRTKQGSVKGVLVIPSNRELQPVEAFLGLPYASPPVGPLRFMPPVTPLPWNGVRLMDKYAPACPQTLPDVSNEREALRFVTRGRLQYLRRLLPYLRNQSEDCLYLNIYAPVTVGGKDVNIKFPVIVFIHGESYEWNSGNPYDGSILASYGDVVVVTFNFRLGVLGFLRPDLRENRAANFGLLDQIAALQWIQENIAEFGGDRESVTLLGHGTGAACVNLLLISPMAQSSNGLFHRAILMSGTALADWAIAENPLRYTLQAAQQARCPLAERDDELASCLRFKRVTELMNVRLQAPLYASPLAPLVDGIVVPNEPQQSMKTYNELFGRYDVMYGVTQSESFHLLNAATVQFGLTETERNRIIRTYVRNSYSSNIDQVTAAILNEYTDWKNPVRDTEEYRNSILEILSDARVVAPVIQMADFHSSIRQRSYFYVFSHQTTNGDYPQNWGSVHGEELAYVFGMPLVGGTNHLVANYTRAEMLLSEMVITYWANFARTGNPNFPPRQKFLTGSSRDRFEPSYVQWPAYDRHSQKYINIDLRPKVKDHYRADKMALWSKLIPELLSNSNGKSISMGGEEGEEDDSEMTTGGGGGFRSILPFFTNSNSIDIKSHPSPTVDSSPHQPHEFSSHSPPLMGAQPEIDRASNHFHRFAVDPPTKGVKNGNSTFNADGHVSGGIALSIVIVIGICFLVLNVCACAGVFYQRDRVRFKEMLLQRQYKLRPANREGNQLISSSPNTATPLAPTVAADGRLNSLSSHRIDVDDTEEDLCAGLDGRRSLRSSLPHQASTSTMDPHTKVSQWMAQEVDVERCPTPPGSTSQCNRLTTKPVMNKLGGSDCYDPRDCSNVDDPATVFFPQLTKSSKASDIYSLLPVKEESAGIEPQQQRQRSTKAGKTSIGTTTKESGNESGSASGPVAGGSSLPYMDSTSSAPTVGRSSTTGRRKPRNKSQLSLQRSITKKDVAVGDDDEPTNSDPSATAPVASACLADNVSLRSSIYGYGTMDTIRRLNYPKVLPDLPQQETPVIRSGSPPSSPIYTTPYAALPANVNFTKSDEKGASTSGRQQRRRSTELPVGDATEQLPRRHYSPRDTTAGSGSASSTIVKTNLPQTLVLAPHPRATGISSSKAPSSHPHHHSVAVSTCQPEPCLVIRPGPRQQHVQTGTPDCPSGYDSNEPPSSTDAVLRRSNPNGANSTSARPANRNSRSWYAQYSQSFISQSIDQESDANETQN